MSDSWLYHEETRVVWGEWRDMCEIVTLVSASLLTVFASLTCCIPYSQVVSSERNTEAVLWATELPNQSAVTVNDWSETFIALESRCWLYPLSITISTVLLHRVRIHLQRFSPDININKDMSRKSICTIIVRTFITSICSCHVYPSCLSLQDRMY